MYAPPLLWKLMALSFCEILKKMAFLPLTQLYNYFCYTLALVFKVHIFWESHKILQNLHQLFDWQYIGNIIGVDCAKNPYNNNIDLTLEEGSDLEKIDFWKLPQYPRPLSTLYSVYSLEWFTYHAFFYSYQYKSVYNI